MLQSGANEPLDLTAAVNDARRLMAYDRKLKNAVSRSIIELLARENLDLTWEMKDHELTGAVVKSRQAAHLGGKKITEDLLGPAFVAMAAALFAGTAGEAGGAPGAEGGRSWPEGAGGGRRRPLEVAFGKHPRPAALSPGQRITVTLLGEKTRKGGWKAETVEGGIVGDIFNSHDVPPEAAPGLEAELVVRVANPTNASFEWLSPEVEKKLAKAQTRRRGQRPKRRRDQQR